MCGSATKRRSSVPTAGNGSVLSAAYAPSTSSVSHKTTPTIPPQEPSQDFHWRPPAATEWMLEQVWDESARLPAPMDWKELCREWDLQEYDTAYDL